MYYSNSSSISCLKKNAPKIIDTIKINGKYFDASMVKEKALIAVSSSAIASILMAIGAVILF